MSDAQTVTVYSTPTCPWCDRAKEYLTSRNVPFTNKDVSVDQEAAMEMIRLTGQQGVPVIAAGSDVIVGFDQVRLAQVADRLSGPRRPALGVLGADATDYLARHLDVAEGYPPGVDGVFVGQVRAGSVAAGSGVQPGDIIRAAAGKRVKNLRTLDQLVESVAPGDTVSLRLLRGPDEVMVSLDFSVPGGRRPRA